MMMNSNGRHKKRNYRRLILSKLVPLGLALGALSAGLYFIAGKGGDRTSVPNSTVKVLSYSSFVASWGPGPDIAKLFEAEAGLHVEYQDADDAGLLLQKLALFPSDVVIGFDQLTLPEARESRKWLKLDESSSNGEAMWKEPDFQAIDWGPMSFIYRKGEIEPPTSLDDLLSARFKGAVSLEDPRTSTPGLQFLYWVLDEKGVDAGFQFLEKLKPSLHSVSGSWSAAYGVFTKKQAKLAFSYLTSPVYHWSEEKDESYQPAIFASGHPVQVEYAGIPEECGNCEGARKFVAFLHKPEVQAIIMKKNFMFPVVKDVAKGTAFEKLPQVQIHEWKSLPELRKRRDELLERWRQLGL